MCFACVFLDLAVEYFKSLFDDYAEGKSILKIVLGYRVTSRYKDFKNSKQNSSSAGLIDQQFDSSREK